MIIEISGAGFHNMGAQLMLVAARDELLSWGNVDEVAINFRIGARAQRDRAGCASVMHLEVSQREWKSRIFGLAVSATPSALLNAARSHKPSDMDALIDVSGFAFGDQWGPLSSRKKARLFSSYADAGKPVILLPQAFGPFTNPDVADAATVALNHASLILARDPESLSHLRGLRLRKPIVEMAPDFTNLVEPVADRFDPGTVIVIPNGRMTEMVDSVTVSSYLEFLRSCTATALDHGFRVIMVAHEAMDRDFTTRLDAEYGDRVSSHEAGDPIRTKALVGGAALVISSRYHGLVNALSQCVPAIGTSWSHKYTQLFADYGCEDGLWETGDPTSAADQLATWLSETSLAQRREALRAPSQSLKAESRAMWSRVQVMLSG